MKKTILFALAIAATADAWAQGQLNLSNPGVKLTVQDTYEHFLNGGNSIVVGSPAVAAGFTGCGPGQVQVTFYAAPNGSALPNLENANAIIATVFNSTSTLMSAQGTLNVINVTLPNEPGIFDGSHPIEVIAFAIDQTGEYFNWSPEATGITPATGSATPTMVFGTGPGQISSFNIINDGPEPSTFAIVGAGAAVLALFRRRK